MPERQPQLERTTQTDLLYGLALEPRSEVATLEPCATTEFAAHQSSRDEVSLSDFNGPRDRVAEIAATRIDSGLHKLPALPDEAGQKSKRGPRWRYADGIAPAPPRAEPAPAAAASPAAVHIEADLPTQPTAKRGWSWWQSSCGWVTSFTFHVIVLPVLALLGIEQVQRSWNATVVVSHAPQSELHDIGLQDIDAPHDFADFSGIGSISDTTTSGSHAANALVRWESLPEHDAPQLPVVLTSQATTGPVDDIRALFQHPGDADRPAGEVGGGGNEASFFGAQASGQKFVFLVDCSTSMAERNRWEHACQELETSIERLSPDQLFYVILFDGLVHRMFNHDEREAALYPATAENKRLLQAWLRTARLGPETRPFLAMRGALDLRPDAIFLLSDGDFNDATASYLKEANRKQEGKRKPEPQAIVHTINLHNRSLSGTAMLKRIARENGGKYTFVTPD